ncbi:hypothetical protein ACQAYK_08905 [Acidithiobacillus sp. AC3]
MTAAPEIKITVIPEVPSSVARVMPLRDLPKSDAPTTEPKLDAADLWLMEHAPEMVGLSATTLANRRRRERHKIGGQILDDAALVADFDLAEADDDQSQPEAVPDVDLIGVARYRAERELIQAIQSCPTIAEAARQIGVSRQAAHKTYTRLLQRAKFRNDARRAMDRWDNLPPTQPIPYGPGQQLDLFGGIL